MKINKKAISLILTAVMVFALAPALIAGAAEAAVRTVIKPQSVPVKAYAVIEDTLYVVVSDYDAQEGTGTSVTYNAKTGQPVEALSELGKYDLVRGYGEGSRLIGVMSGGKWGFVDKTGNVVVAPKYDFTLGFSEGFAAVRVGDWETGKWGFIDETGNELIAPKYDSASSFSEGLARFEVNGINGFINDKGTEVVAPKYDWASDFSDGIAIVKLDGKVGFIDNTGKEVFSGLEYDWVWVSGFFEGLAAVDIYGKYGFIDKNGDEVIAPKYDYSWKFSEGLAAVGLGDWETRKWGFIDKDGDEVVAPKYDWVSNFSEGLAAVRLDGKVGFIDNTGEEVIPLQFNYAGDFTNGLAMAGIDGNTIIIDKTGNDVVPAGNDYIILMEVLGGESYFSLRQGDDYSVIAIGTAGADDDDDDDQDKDDDDQDKDDPPATPPEQPGDPGDDRPHASREDVEPFVSRFYEKILGRNWAEDPDAEEWIQRLIDREVSGIDIAVRFFLSEEFKKEELSDEEFVELAYQVMLGRDGEPDGVEYWLDKLAQGTPRAVLILGFSMSDEFTGLCDAANIDNVPRGSKEAYARGFVARLYYICLDREPIDDGIEIHTQRLLDGATGRQVAADFILGEEMGNREDVDAKAFAAICYAAILGRDCEEWELEIQAERAAADNGRQVVFDDFVDSPEFKTLCEGYGIKP